MGRPGRFIELHLGHETPKLGQGLTILRSVRPLLRRDDVLEVCNHDGYLVAGDERHRPSDNVAIEEAVPVSGGDVNEQIQIADVSSPRGDLHLPDCDPVESQRKCR